MADEPTLPHLPAVSWDERSQSFSNHRKRGRISYNNASSSVFNSSDPAVFSSDDDPALDNYVEGRRKRRYMGTWYSKEAKSSDSTFGSDDTSTTPKAPRPRRPWKRNDDSGVFLGSDDTENGDSTWKISELPGSTPRPKQLRKIGLVELPDNELQVSPLRLRQRRTNTSPAELKVRQLIQSCIDRGEPEIVLHSSGLTELSDATVAPLAHLTRIPFVGRDVAFESEPTHLRINLATNLLTRLPEVLFNLENLTMLSLRGNRLKELPGSIGKLRNLEELNIAQNELKCLPSELLELIETSTKLDKLTLHPNPFWQPDSKYSAAATSLKDRVTIRTRKDHGALPWPLHITKRLAYSEEFNNVLGRLIPQTHVPLDRSAREVTLHESAIKELEEPTATEGAKAVVRTPLPSLLELALRSCAASAHLADLAEMMPSDLHHLQNLLTRTNALKQDGDMRCTECKSVTAIPAFEWLDWRFITTISVMVRASVQSGVPVMRLSHEGEFAVPFLARACSRNCGPEAKLGWAGPQGRTDIELISMTGPKGPNRGACTVSAANRRRFRTPALD